jgi:hypothetical protein
MIFASFVRKSSMDFLSHGQFALLSIDQVFIIMTNLFRFSTFGVQHHRLVKHSNYINDSSNLDLGTKNLKNLPHNKIDVKKAYFMECSPC